MSIWIRRIFPTRSCFNGTTGPPGNIALTGAPTILIMAPPGQHHAVSWVDDSLPAGASAGADGGDSWLWVSNNPAPVSGAVANQSAIATGQHQHYFWGATSTLTVSASDILFAYVYVDPANRPSELMLQWNDGSWEHRAYWGTNAINYGVDGTATRRYMGPVPASGQWVRLEVPATNVNLAGSTVSGMAFTLYGGRVTWDYAGKAAASLTNSIPNTNSTPPVTNTVPITNVTQTSVT